MFPMNNYAPVDVAIRGILFRGGGDERVSGAFKYEARLFEYAFL